MTTRIFILEDEVWIRKGIIGKIDWDGLDFSLVGEASDGIDGLACIRQLEPDIVLLDIHLPGMNGLEVLHALQSQLDRMKVVVISGYDEFKYAREAMKYGITDYLLKPVNDTELTDVLIKLRERLMSERRLQELADESSQSTESSSSPADMSKLSGDEIVLRVKAFMEEHCSDPITLKFVADHYYVHPTYFSALFKQTVGHSFHDYLMGLRLKKSAQILKFSGNIHEVAAKSGYQDRYYFAKVFKKYYGMSPVEYRARLQEE